MDYKKCYKSRKKNQNHAQPRSRSRHSKESPDQAENRRKEIMELLTEALKKWFKQQERQKNQSPSPRRVFSPNIVDTTGDDDYQKADKDNSDAPPPSNESEIEPGMIFNGVDAYSEEGGPAPTIPKVSNTT